MLEMSSPTAASISCRTKPRSPFRTRLRRLPPRRPRPPPPRGAAPREPIASVYPAAGSHIFADGRNPPGWSGWLYATAGLRIAGSRLSDHSGAHVLSRSKPDGDGDDGDGAPGASVRSTAGFEPDDLHQFRRMFRHCAAVQPHSEYR